MPKNSKLPSKWLIVGAMMVFLGTAFIAIYINSYVFNYGLHLNESISHYVGLELWSAIFFTLGNIFVAIFVANYLWKLGQAWRMPKIFYWLIVVLAVTLMGLSFFPSDFYQDGSGNPSIITWVHILTSRAMFIAMMLIAALVIMCRHASTLAHVLNVLFLMYAVGCIMGFTTEAGWFMQNVMVLETLYLVGFMTVLAACDEKREHLRDLHAEEW